MSFSLYNRFRDLEKVRVDSNAIEGYLGASSTDGVLRTSAPLTYTDGGNYITLGLDITASYTFGSITVDSGAAQSIIIKGTSTGNANVGWIGFYDSDGTTRRGHIGDGSSNDDDIYIGADTGYLRLLAAGYISLGTHTYFPDDVVVSFGASLDYSIGFANATDTLQIVDGTTLGSNVRLELDSSGHFDFGAGNLSTTGTLGCGTITVANGGSINLQEDITFTGATTENLIKMPDNLLDALSIQEGSNKYVTFDTVDDEEDIFFYKSVDILHTATHADDHALEIDTDAAMLGDVKAIDIDYITGQIDTGQDEGIILINIDETIADGGDVFGLEVLSTDGSANIYGMKVGAVVNPIHQDSGTFDNPDIGTNNTISTNVPYMTDGILANTTNIFQNDTEYIIIGVTAAAFQEIEFIIATGASGAGIKPTFHYSTAVGGVFAEFTPVDGTSGFKHTGVVAWDADDLATPAHAANPNTNKFEIKVVRTRGNLTTFPVLGYAKYAATVEYTWDKSGDVNIKNLTTTDKVGIGLTPTANMVGLSIEEGLLTLKERTTPTADTNYGKIYTKTDDKLYFQDGAGAEHEIAYAP